MSGSAGGAGAGPGTVAAAGASPDVAGGETDWDNILSALDNAPADAPAAGGIPPVMPTPGRGGRSGRRSRRPAQAPPPPPTPTPAAPGPIPAVSTEFANLGARSSASDVDDRSRYGTDLFLLPVAGLFLLAVIIQMVEIGRRFGVEAAIIDGLSTLFGVLLLAVPGAALGTFLASLVLRFRVEGSLYLKTFTWVAAPSGLMALGQVIAGHDGALIGGICGLALVLPVYRWSHGTRIHESIPGFISGIISAAVFVVAVAFSIMLMADAIGWGRRDEPDRAAAAVAQRQLDFELAQARREAESEERIRRMEELSRRYSPGIRTPSGGSTPAAPPATVEQLVQWAQPGQHTTPDAVTQLAMRSPVLEHREAALRAFDAATEHSDPQVRRAGLQGLARWDPDRVLPRVIHAIGDGDASERSAAVRLLGDARPQQAIEPLVRAARTDRHAAHILKDYGDKAEPAVLAELERELTTSEMARLLELLGDVGTKDAVPTLRKLADHESPSVAHAAMTTWQALAPDTFDPLRFVLYDLGSDSATRQAAAFKQLAEMQVVPERKAAVSARLLALLDESTYLNEQQFTAALTPWRTDETVKTLIGWLNDEQTEPRRRHLAMHLLSTWQLPEAVGPITQWFLKDRFRVKQILINFGPAAEEEVIHLLRHDDMSVVRDACDILEQIGGRRAMRALGALAGRRDAYLADRARETIRAINLRLPGRE